MEMHRLMNRLLSRVSDLKLVNSQLRTNFASSSSVASAGPDLVIHLDLNKSILAVDEVKNYGKEEVVYLEQWKGDAEFLAWAHAEHGGAVEREVWIADLKQSKNEPQLIEHALAYCRLDPARQAAMDAILAHVDEGNCVASFWRLCDWARAESGRRVLICFRTFGVDLPAMFAHCERRGYGAHLVRNAAGRGESWTVVHALNGAKGFGSDWVTEEDTVGRAAAPARARAGAAAARYIQPGNPVPGPKEKHTPEFAARTAVFEEKAKALFESAGALEPSVYTGVPAVDPATHQLLPFAALDPAYLHPVTSLNALLAAVPIPLWEAEGEGAQGEGVHDRGGLRIMGIQDNYKPWSRKNPLNGKVAVLDASGAAPFRQLFFDDYSFTKSDNEGAYIWALHDAGGAPIMGTKAKLAARFGGSDDERRLGLASGSGSGDGRSGGDGGDLPCVFTVVLNKKGQTATSVQDAEYFTRRVTHALATTNANANTNANAGEDGSRL